MSRHWLGYNMWSFRAKGQPCEWTCKCVDLIPILLLLVGAWARGNKNLVSCESRTRQSYAIRDRLARLTYRTDGRYSRKSYYDRARAFLHALHNEYVEKVAFWLDRYNVREKENMMVGWIRLRNRICSDSIYAGFPSRHALIEECVFMPTYKVLCRSLSCRKKDALRTYACTQYALK